VLPTPVRSAQDPATAVVLQHVRAGIAVAGRAATLTLESVERSRTAQPWTGTPHGRRLAGMLNSAVRRWPAGCASAATAQTSSPRAALPRYYPATATSTVAAKIVAVAPDVDALVAAASGGGLAAGTALAAGRRAVVTVEPARCRAVHAALEAGTPVDVEIDSVAAALGATRIGEFPFAVLRTAPVVPLLVTDAEILADRQRLWEEFRLRVEPAAAAPFAAWLAGHENFGQNGQPGAVDAPTLRTPQALPPARGSAARVPPRVPAIGTPPRGPSRCRHRLAEEHGADRSAQW
jgi:threonine dehydratase